MDEGKRHEINQWLIKSQRDLGSAKRLMLGEEPYFDTGVYHCQQSAEKALKAYLVHQDIEIEKTHNLVTLLERCTLSEPRFEQWRQAAMTLTP
jgi:HEPN domain-containing protein